MTRLPTVMRTVLCRYRKHGAREDPDTQVSDSAMERLPAYPARRDGVEIGRTDGEKTASVQLPGGRYLRLGRDAAAFLAGLDGSRRREEVLAQWSIAVGERTALDLLTRFAAAGLLQLPGAPKTSPEKRFTYRKPMSWQFTVARPDRLTGALRAVGRVLARQPVPLLYPLLLVGGVCAAVSGRVSLVRAMSEPVPLRVALAVSAAVVAVSVLHEFGHAIALTHFGGRPRRMGVMLFYLVPAFFCDVSDGWRLPARTHRVLVALSGVMVNVGVAAISAIAGELSTGDRATFWWLLAVANVTTTAFNLLPFIKLDGYLALMGVVDVPFLRRRAMDDARAWLGRVVFGRVRETKRLTRAWSVPFGLCALVFPVLVVGVVLARVLLALLPMGTAGSVLSLVVVLLAVSRLLYGVALIALPPTATARPRAGLPRRLLGIGVLVAAAAVPLCALRVDVTETGGYITGRGGTVLVMPQEGNPLRAVRPGDKVLLRSAGLILSPVVATATVEGGTARRATIATAALGPVQDLPGRTEGAPYWLSGMSTVNGTPLPRSGKATVTTGRTSFAAWVARTYVLTPLRTLAG